MDDTIIGGHQRIEVLKKCKVQDVECWVPNEMLDEKQVEELCLRLNRNHGDFDYDVLANEFDLPDLIECGFTVEELQLDLGDEITEKKAKKKKNCPNCGHEL